MAITNTTSGEQLFITNAGALTIGIRMDRVLSFSFSEPELTLALGTPVIRYRTNSSEAIVR